MAVIGGRCMNCGKEKETDCTCFLSTAAEVLRKEREKYRTAFLDYPSYYQCKYKDELGCEVRFNFALMARGEWLCHITTDETCTNVSNCKLDSKSMNEYFELAYI